LRSIDSVLGFLNFEAVRYDAEIQRLIDARNKARSEKNWGDADQIREQLKSRGVVLQDQKIY
jgi:cysteinyl-tRNA synthetase